MTLLTPLFLLGALTVAIPILLHFTRHRPKNLTPFSAVMFLGPDRPTLRRRRRLEHWPLLLLRCLILALLALAFARPFLNDPIAALTRPGDQRVILLIDTSASMTALPATRAAAEKILATLSPTADLAILTFARRPHLALDFDQYRATPTDQRPALLATILDSLPTSSTSTNPGEALLAASDLLAASTSPDPATIHLISDFQQTADFDAAATIDWPANVTVHPTRISHATDAIPTLTLASATNEAITLIATNPGTATTATLTPESAATTPAGIPVPPGTNTLTFPANLTTTSYTATLSDGKSPFATVYVAQIRAPTVPVDYLGSDADADPNASLFYLTRGLATPARFTTDLTVNQPREAATKIIATDFNATTAASLRTALLAGSHAFLLLRDPADARWIGALTTQPATATESPTTPFTLLASIDYSDPIFAPFADPRFSDFSKIHFWKHRVLTGPAVDSATTLARFDDGTPALLRLPVGDGSLLVLTTTWTPADSQLALSSKFVPLLLSILESTANLPPEKRQYLAGDRTPPSVRDAASRRTSRQSAPREPAGFLDTPGLYETATTTYAVNVDSREADLSPLTDPAILALNLPTAPTAKDREQANATTRQLAREELESRNPLWQAVLLATLAVILAETLLATRVHSKLETHESKI